MLLPEPADADIRTSLAAAVHYDDGCIRLVNPESEWLSVEPTLWRNGAKVCEEICSHIPAHLIVEQGPRNKDSIPKPQTTRWQRLLAAIK